MFNFVGKVALVTGGSNGIGRATALLFARHGAKVVIADIDPAGQETAELIKRERGEASFVQTDVRETNEVQHLVARAIETYGGLQCAFNNAGVLPPTTLLGDMDDATFDKVLAVDLKGVFLCMKYEIQHMLQGSGGAIVNNASIAGMIADPGISAYVAAKHGVIGLSKAAAIEYAGKGIRINAIAPGLVETSMTSIGSMIRIFAAISWLIRQLVDSPNRKRSPIPCYSSVLISRHLLSVRPSQLMAVTPLAERDDFRPNLMRERRSTRDRVPYFSCSVFMGPKSYCPLFFLFGSCNGVISTSRIAEM